MATPRIGLRFAQSLRPTTTNINAFRQPFTRQMIARRTQTTAAAPSENAMVRLWNSPIGPKTVHFWAPIMKWGLVLAGAADFARPAESLSLTQNFALMCTGAIWTRWCFVIKPKNMFLAAVNFFLFCVGATQVGRIVSYNQSLKHTSIGQEIKEEFEHEKDAVKKFVEDPKGALQNIKSA